MDFHAGKELTNKKKQKHHGNHCGTASTMPHHHQPHTHQNLHRKYEVVYLAMKACNFSSTHCEQLTMTTKIRYEGKAVNCFHETMCV
jgi:hypothetical protein